MQVLARHQHLYARDGDFHIIKIRGYNVNIGFVGLGGGVRSIYGEIHNAEAQWNPRPPVPLPGFIISEHAKC